MRFERKQFSNYSEEEAGKVIESCEFINCKFTGCYINFSDNPDERTTVKKVVLRNCEQKKCIIGAAILEDVTVENLKCSGLLQTWGAAFKRVKFKGEIGPLMISQDIRAATAPPNIQKKFDKQNKEIYRNIEWALDISEALFEECEIRSIPAALIVRDPETQIVVDRKTLVKVDLSKINFLGTYFLQALNLFLEREEDDYVLIAPRLDNDFGSFKTVIDNLVKLGIAKR